MRTINADELLKWLKWELKYDPYLLITDVIDHINQQLTEQEKEDVTK